MKNVLVGGSLLFSSIVGFGLTSMGSASELPMLGCEHSRVGCNFPTIAESISGPDAEVLFDKLPVVTKSQEESDNPFNFSTTTHGAQANFGIKLIQVKCQQRILRTTVTNCTISESAFSTLALPALTPFALVSLLAKGVKTDPEEIGSEAGLNQ